MLRSRAFRLVAGGVALLGLFAVAWAAWQGWQVSRSLQASVDHAQALRAAVADGDQTAADRELAALQESSADAAERTGGITWSILTVLPVYGDDARGVEVVSSVVNDLARGDVSTLVDVSQRIDEIAPRDGRVPIETVESLEEHVTDAHAALTEAEQRLAAEDSSQFTGALEEHYRGLQRQVAEAADAMGSAERAVRVLPAMLGGEGERRYLMVFQNNAEVRATGGLPGAISELTADDGGLRITRQAAASDFGATAEPVLTLTPAERELYDDKLGTYFLNANMTPDVPRAAELMRARWAREFPGAQVDGVVLMDTVALSYVLSATGPVTVGDVTLTADNVVDVLLHDVYLEIEDPEAQDAFFAEVASVAFDRFVTGIGDPMALIEELARAVDERRVFVHSFHAEEQAELAGTAISGEFVTDPDHPSPQVGVTFNDATASKMSYFLRYEVDVTSTYCSDGVQGLSAKARVGSQAPADAGQLPDYVTGGETFGVKPGNQLVTMRVYGPAGGSIKEVEVDSKPVRPIKTDQDGRPVGMLYLELEPGETADVAWTMTSGEGQTGPSDLQLTPSLASGEPAMVPTTCGGE